MFHDLGHPAADSPSEPTIPGDAADLAQLLDDHHLVVIGEDRLARASFVQDLVEHLETIPDTDVVVLDGSFIVDMSTFCTELERRLGGRHRAGRTMAGLVRLLRHPPREPKHQYFVWRDADVLLEHDVRLFGRLTNALLAVAAEREHLSPDVLVLQRVVFVGGDKLGAYAEEERGQFHDWLLEEDGQPFWEVVCCLPHPPVLAYRLDG